MYPSLQERDGVRKLGITPLSMIEAGVALP
jgi:hypothetical protein